MLAHIRTTDEFHFVCSKCPDSEAVQRAFETEEKKRAIAAAAHACQITIRRVILSLCDPCIDKIEQEESRIANLHLGWAADNGKRWPGYPNTPTYDTRHHTILPRLSTGEGTSETEVREPGHDDV